MALTRRDFLKLTLRGTLGVGVAAMGGTAWATQYEPHLLDITRHQILLHGLPTSLNEFTLAQITDLHFGDWMNRERMTRIVEQVNALTPDIVVITGDFFSVHTPDVLQECVESLALLRPPVYAILGNHDHWTNAAVSAQTVRDAGVTLLQNEHRILEGGLVLAGVDDIWENQHDLRAALSGVEMGAPVVLLAHEPDYADEAALDGRIGLMLSGHSHGGQVRIPLFGAPILPYLGRKYPMGRYRVGEMNLYTNRGVGMIAPFVRLGCPPEIALITLHSS